MAQYFIPTTSDAFPAPPRPSRLRRWIRRSSYAVAAAMLAAAGMVLTQDANAAGPEWTLTTYHMRGGPAFDVDGWNTDIRRLMAGTDVLALQEVGPQAPGDLVGTDEDVVHRAWNVGTNARPTILHTYFLDTDATGHRVNLAMVTRYPADDVYRVEAASDTGRESFGLVFGDSVYYDLHAVSPDGDDVPGMLDNYAAVAAASGRKWAALGDFNRAPSSFSPPAGGLIVHPGAATRRSGGELDYLVTSSTQPRQVDAALSAGLSSDHFPVRFAI